MARSPYHHGNLRDALLVEAEHALRHDGVDRLSLRDLARQVGVSHGAPRRHFPDRRSLLDALAESGFARLGDRLRAAAEAEGDDYEARLRATATAYLHFAISDAALLNLMFASKVSEQGAAVREAADRALSSVVELIEEGQARAMLELGAPQRIGLLLFATMQGFAALVCAGIVPSDLIDDLAADAITRFLHGPGLDPAPPE